MIISEVKQSCLQEQVKHSSDAGDNNEDVSEEKSYSWKPLLLFISLRLGLTEINPVYKSSLKTCFSLPSSLGVIGGSPNHALYLVGVVEDEVLYLDPHTTQPCVSSVDDSYHISRPGRISISQLDPSLALCFLCITEQEFDNLCIAIQVSTLSEHTSVLQYYESLNSVCKKCFLEILYKRRVLPTVLSCYVFASNKILQTKLNRTPRFSE